MDLDEDLALRPEASGDLSQDSDQGNGMIKLGFHRTAWRVD